MNNYLKTSLLIILCFSFVTSAFSENNTDRKNITSVDLKYIGGNEVVSVLRTLIDKSISISFHNNQLLINGSKEKIKNILPIVEKIDTPATALTIEFIASNQKINFNQKDKLYQSSKNRNKSSQSMSIIERQWVKLNTGLSVPITERKRAADGTETQSFRYKRINKSYLFKVHEFSGWSVIQVGLNESYLSNNIAGAIEHTQLDTTIVGKNNEWLEIASSKPIADSGNSNTYSTKSRNKNHIYLYVKVKKYQDKLKETK